jgi:hypothetical protein
MKSENPASNDVSRKKATIALDEGLVVFGFSQVRTGAQASARQSWRWRANIRH